MEMVVMPTTMARTIDWMKKNAICSKTESKNDDSGFERFNHSYSGIEFPVWWLGPALWSREKELSPCGAEATL